MSILIRPIRPEDADAYREVRLRALAQDAAAFCSKFENEAKFDASQWLARVNRCDGLRQCGYFAETDGRVVGLVVGFFERPDVSHVQLVSMWVAPEARGRGAGTLLVQAVLTWARSRGAERVLLDVTEPNIATAAFYRRLGFADAARVEATCCGKPALLTLAISLSPLQVRLRDDAPPRSLA